MLSLTGSGFVEIIKKIIKILFNFFTNDISSTKNENSVKYEHIVLYYVAILHDFFGMGCAQCSGVSTVTGCLAAMATCCATRPDAECAAVGRSVTPPEFKRMARRAGCVRPTKQKYPGGLLGMCQWRPGGCRPEWKLSCTGVRVMT